MASPAVAKNYFVTTQAEYFAAEKKVVAGDVITLANGEWQDFEIKFSGQGTKDKPITLKSETAGKVIITGQSNLRIGGQYMLVAGLVFTNGFSPTNEVISFRISKNVLSFNSRVTETVIDGFSKPDRFESDYWVGIYGKNNRFDHNHLSGKTNKGVTLAVRLTSTDSQENYHRIDHVYFGPRPVLGSNGGETLRIGTSKYSAANSYTLVENNYFDRCDGEVEIISSKSGGNIFRGNVFYQSSGTLTLRHGNDTLVENNIFFGNGKDHSGGIRVINENQTVRNNYMEGLMGTGFASALTVMNGVPNSPINRYVQVDNAVVENNSVINSRRVTFNAGADSERSAPPVNSRFTGNILTGTNTDDFIAVQDDISGIDFAQNYLANGGADKALTGVKSAEIKFKRAANGLLYPVGVEGGVSRDLKPVTADQTGASWYAKPQAGNVFGKGEIIAVSPGEDTLNKAFASAKEGDTLLLSPGEYILSKTLALDKTITIETGPFEPGVKQAVIKFGRPSLIEIREGGNLSLKNIIIDGELAPDSVGNAVIRTTIYPIQSNFLIEMDGVTVRNLDVNKAFHVINLGKSSFADRVTITNSLFENVTGSILLAAAETEDYGQYNAEYVTVADSQFTNIGSAAFNIYRGGRDESTFGPHVAINGSVFTNVGRSGNNASGVSLLLHGVQYADIDKNTFTNSAPLAVRHTVGRPQTAIENNVFSDTAEPVLEELNYEGKHRAVVTGNIIASPSSEEREF
jgi:poly(beta-D-mannuronate) lyase